jgi:hypothetical protein
MNISNEELELLLEVENYLWNNAEDINIYLRLHNLNSRLLQSKATRNERTKENNNNDIFLYDLQRKLV